MRRTPLLLVLAVALAVAAWFVLRPHSGAPASGGTAASRGAPVLAVSPAGARDTDSSYVLADPRGTLRLEGQVIDADDSPVGGATVVIDTVPARTVTTEADGTFAIDALIARDYTVAAWSGDLVAGPMIARLDATSDPVVLRMREGASVTVAVRDAAGGAPLAGVTVELRGIDRRLATTDDRGEARLRGVPAGAYDVAARLDGYAPAALAASVGAAGEVRVEIGLRRGAPVAGRVVDDHGAAVAGALVTWEGASEWGLRADPRWDAIATDAEGRFRIDALPAGSFRFVARHPGRRTGSSSPVLLDGTTPVDGVEIRLEPGATVAGHVIDAAGRPVDGARVRAGGDDGRGEVVEARTDGGGRFRIDGLPPRGLAIVAVAARGSSEVVEVDGAAPPADLELRVSARGRLAGVVVDAAGEPLDGAVVIALPDPASGASLTAWQLRGPARARSDAGGRFAIEGVDDGAYLLRAAPPASAGCRRDGPGALDGVLASVKAGDEAIRLVVTGDGAVRGQVGLAGGGVPATFSLVVDAGVATPFATRDGSFVLGCVPPGVHALLVRGPGFEARRLDAIAIRADETTELGAIVVTPGRSVSGRVVQEGAPVGGATIRAGRMLFGDGSSSKAEVGGRGGELRETVSDERGEFVLGGVGATRTFVLAEGPTGRSQVVEIPASRDSVGDVELRLDRTGALAGRVTRNHRGIEGVIVNARTPAAPGVFYGVTSGADGTFRFDRLAPGRYKVSAMTPQLTGMCFFAVATTITPGADATIELAIDGGTSRVEVTPQVSGEGGLAFATVALARGAVAVHTARELEPTLAAIEQGFSALGVSLRAAPATIAAVPAGDYSACVVAYPSTITSLAAARAYAERAGDTLPVVCRPIHVDGTSPAAVQVPVAVPPSAG